MRYSEFGNLILSRLPVIFGTDVPLIDESSGYYSTDSNGLAVQSAAPVACMCQVALRLPMGALLEYGGCRAWEKVSLTPALCP
jgi:hypothetical protein